MSKWKVAVLFLFIGVLIANLSACQPTPTVESIDQKENIEDVIKDNKEKENPSPNNDSTLKMLKDTVKAPEKSVFEITSGNGSLHIKVNADIILPEVSEVPVYNAVRKDFNDEDAKKLIHIFFGENPLYPEIQYEDMTKDELLNEIAKLQEMWEDVKESAKSGKEGDYEDLVSELQTMVATAPETIEREPFQDYKMVTYGENILTNKYFAGQGDINGINGHIHIQSSKEYTGVSIIKDNPEPGMYLNDVILAAAGFGIEDRKTICKLSSEEAIAQCIEVLSQYGVDQEYSVFSARKVVKNVGIENGYVGYEIKFSRNAGGILETYDLYDGNESRDEVNTYPYGFEKIRFIVTDNGIENFEWISPMTLGDKLAENVALLSYEEIENIFKERVLLKFADIEDETVMNVSEIRFGYMRVRNKDNQEEFTLVPTWDFIGDYDAGASLLTINAVDGSILDRRYGY
ncbi:MAG: hypothetical protein K0S47_434 [Herbinix sp.]|jgi:hypothetical protein|nr:hypothetical protein [Herbinix sp.]